MIGRALGSMSVAALLELRAAVSAELVRRGAPSPGDSPVLAALRARVKALGPGDYAACELLRGFRGNHDYASRELSKRAASPGLLCGPLIVQKQGGRGSVRYLVRETSELHRPLWLENTGVASQTRTPRAHGAERFEYLHQPRGGNGVAAGPFPRGRSTKRDQAHKGVQNMKAAQTYPSVAVLDARDEVLWEYLEGLRREMTLPGETEDEGRRRFLASQHMARRYRLAELQVSEERFAAETHLAPLTVRGIRGDYYLGLETRDDSWIEDLATVYTTDQPQEDYPFLGMVPRLRKWEGPRTVQELNRGKITILNDDYEDTISIKGKDWRRDKSKQMSEKVQEMGEAAAELPLDLLSAILNTGHTTSLAWDGVALFGTHVWGEASIDNDLGTGDGLAGGAAPTAAQMAQNIFLSIMRLLSFKDDRGRPFNTRAKSFKVMIPPNMLAATEAALADMFTAAGVSNTLATAVAKGTLKISYYWNPRLTATDTFFLWRDDARVRPLIYQEEFIKSPYLLAEGSEHYQRTNEVEIGSHIAGGAAAGKYELIIRGKCA